MRDHANHFQGKLCNHTRETESILSKINYATALRIMSPSYRWKPIGYYSGDMFRATEKQSDSDSDVKCATV